MSIRDSWNILNGSLAAFGLKLLGAGLTFILHILITRNLGASWAGVYFLSLSIATIATIISRVGLDNTVVRLMAGCSAAGDNAAVQGVFASSLRIVLAGGAVSTVVLYLLAPVISHHFFEKPELVVPLRIMTVRILPIAVIMIIGESFRGLKQIRRSQITQVILFPLFMITLLLGIPGDLNVEQISYLMVCCAVAAMLAGFVIWKVSAPSLKNIQSRHCGENLLTASLPLLTIAILDLVIMWSSTIFLGLFNTNAEIGIYQAAYRTSTITKYTLTSIGVIAAPSFAELVHRGDLNRLAGLTHKVTAVMVISTLPVIWAIFQFADEILSLFGNNFTIGTTALLILTCGQIVNVLTGPVNHLLVMGGYGRDLRNVIFFAAIAIILLNAVLIPVYGIKGAALASSAALAIENLGALIMVRIRLGFWTTPFSFLHRARQAVS